MSEMQRVDLLPLAAALPEAWRSTVAARLPGMAVKVLRMDGAAYPEEVHDYEEALLVLEGCMRLQWGDRTESFHAGELCVVPPGLAHAVAPGSQGTLLILEPASAGG